MDWLPNIKKDHIKQDVLPILFPVLLLNFFKILISCLIAIKSHVTGYCETVYETSNKSWFWSIKTSGESFVNVRLGFRATSLATYAFSTLVKNTSGFD